MAISTINPGVDTSFSTKLNGNFAETRHLVTRTYTNAIFSTTSSSMQDVVTLNTPAATKASQTVFIDMAASLNKDTADGIEVEVWDDSAGVQVVSYLQGGGVFGDTFVVFLQGTVTLAAATNTKSIQIRYRRSSGSASSVTVYGARITCMLVES